MELRRNVKSTDQANFRPSIRPVLPPTRDTSPASTPSTISHLTRPTFNLTRRPTTPHLTARKAQNR